MSEMGVIVKLLSIKNEQNIYNKILEAFNNYDVEGEIQVIVNGPGITRGFTPKTGSFEAYINHESSPIIKIDIEEVAVGKFSVLDAWELH